MIFNEKTGNGSRVSFKTKLFTIVTAVTLSGAAAVLPFAAMADATMDALQAQIAALQAQLAALSGSSSSSTMTVGACTFTRSLMMGTKGNDVTCLQDYLKSTGHFSYSGGSTGYFGGITKSAVAAWQAANGVSPAVGYFGTISRAKYDMVVSTVPSTPTSTPTPTGSQTPSPTTSPVAGSGLTVAAGSTQPAEGALAPAVAARVPALNAVFTAASDGDVTVKSILIQRVGQADDSAIDAVVLIDDTGTQIGLSKTLNALHQASLNEPVVIRAGTSKTLTIAFNRPAAGTNGGQIAKFQIVSVDAGTSKVTGAFPMIGPGVTINETLGIGTLASPARGVLDPGAARSSLQVGATAFYSTGARWTVGSAEAVSLEQVRFYQAGSAGSGDLTNVMVTVKGTDYATTLSADGKYYLAKFSPVLVFDKGAIIEIALKADVSGGSNRTIDFDIQRRTDIVVRGNVFNYAIIPANGSTANTTTQGEGFTSTEPYYDAYLHTISTGSLRIEKSNTVPAGNVSVDTSNTVVGAFGFEAKGEQVQISSLKFTFSEGINTTASRISGVSLVDAAGATVAGPKDTTTTVPSTVTFSDTFTVPVGYNVYKLVAKLSSNFADGTVVSASTTPGSDITAKGLITGLTLTPTPSTAVGGNSMTIRKASLKTSVSDSPVAQNVVRGVNGYLFSKIQYDATASGEDLRVTSQDIQIVTSASADADVLNTCQMFDGTTALNTGGNVVNPSGNAANDDVEGVFTFDNNLIIPKGTVKLVDVKCNIGQDATADATWSMGLVAASDTVVVGKDTGISVTEVATVSNGQIMTVRASGSFTVALDSASPSERFGIAGKADVGATIFKLSAVYEAVKLTKFGFSLASSTASTSDVVKVSFWDGATKVGEAVFTSGNFRATTTLTSDFIIPKDGDKVLSTTVDLISASSLGQVTTTGGDSGHLVVINWDGAALVTTEGIGQSSGSTLNTSGTDLANVKGIRVVKSYPTLERLAVPTNTLANGDMDLYRFKVTAPADGGIGLYRFTFRVSSTTVATTSSFRLFAYTDSGFSGQAYSTNPVNSQSVSCVNGWSLERVTTSDCNAFLNKAATSSHVIMFFDPVTNTQATPNAEAIQIPAGQSRYFKFVANITRSTTGDSFSAALVGDASFFPTLTTFGGSGIPRDSLSLASLVASSSFFVWSPNTTTTSATTTNDWLNGYLLPGLPTTEMSQQTFSK